MSGTVILTDPRHMPVTARTTRTAERMTAASAGRLPICFISEKLGIKDGCDFLNGIGSPDSLTLGSIAVYLWSADYKEDYFKYSFNVEKDEPEKVLEAISFLIGYVRGYHAAEDKAKEVEFGPLEEVKPATVEAA